MRFDTRRAALRSATQAAHQSLDDLISDFTTTDDYGRYVRATWAFRSVVETRILAGTTEAPWQSEQLEPAAPADILDLDLEIPPQLPVRGGVADPSALMGVHYVLEGSALGARLLVKRAAALGFSEDFGARHLALQIRRSRWPAFIAALERMRPFAIDPAVTAALETFAIAHEAFREHCR